MSNIFSDPAGKNNKTGVFAILIAALIGFLFSLNGNYVSGFSESGCEGDCNKCHSLNKTEAGDILKKIKVTDAKVRDIRMSPIKGLWEVTVDSQGKNGLVYVDFSKKYIVQGPIVEVATGVDKTREQYKIMQESRKKVDVSRISLKNALVLGDRKAKKRVIVFTDPDCPFCARLHDEMKKVVEKRKDIVFFIRLFPLKMHPDSYWKSRSIVCNKSLQMIDDNFAKKPIARTECDTKEVDNTIRLAENLGITGTPTMILPDGAMHVGAMGADQLIDLIDGKKK